MIKYLKDCLKSQKYNFHAFILLYEIKKFKYLDSFIKM